MHSVRAIASYDPTADFAERYPDWTLYLSETPASAQEIYLPDLRNIFVSRLAWERDPDYALAHVVAHLDMDHEFDGPFSHEVEMQAKYLATVRLDREATRNDPMPQWR